MTKEFDPDHYMCADCEDIIYSRYPGEFVMCSCKAIYVDQTPYYSRYGGQPEKFIQVDKDGNPTGKTLASEKDEADT